MPLKTPPKSKQERCLADILDYARKRAERDGCEVVLGVTAQVDAQGVTRYHGQIGVRVKAEGNGRLPS